MTDPLDGRLLLQLQQDSRQSNQQLADSVGMSSSACWRRVAALEAAGIITRYAALVDREKAGFAMSAIVHVSLDRHDEQFVSQFVHPGDNACIYVYKQLGITNVIIGIKSSQFPSYAISLQRMLLMVFAQYVFGLLFVGIPAFLLVGWLSPILAILITIVVPSYGVWTLVSAYKEMARDFAGTQ